MSARLDREGTVDGGGGPIMKLEIELEYYYLAHIPLCKRLPTASYLGRTLMTFRVRALMAFIIGNAFGKLLLLRLVRQEVVES